MIGTRRSRYAATSIPRRWNPTEPVAVVAVGAVPVVVVVSGTFISCRVWPGPNSMPVVNGNGVLVRAATQSGPVMLESLCVIVPASVCTLVPGTAPVVALVVPVVVVPVAVGMLPGAVVVPPVVADVVTPAAAPARLIAAPHVGVSPVFVTTTSVTISIWPAGTVNAVTAVVPAGTMRVISTRFSTTGGAVDVAGDALTPGTLVGEMPVVDVVPLPMVVVLVPSEPIVVVWAES